MFKHGVSNKGVSVVEYALLAALIGTASVLAVTTFGTQTASLFEREDLRLADSNGGGGDGSSGGSTGSGDGLGDHRATQNLDMSLFRIVNINDPLNPSDAATKSYVDTMVASISTQGDDLGDHTATQNLNLATNRIVNLGAPQDPADATTKAYVDAAVSGISGGDNLGDHTAIQNIVLGNNWLSNDGSNAGIRISPDHNVGIGTSSPTNNLTIGAVAGGDRSLRLNSLGQSGLRFETVGAAGQQKIEAVTEAPSGNSFLTLHTSGTGTLSERMRITASGNVGIGTTAPGARLQVSGNDEIAQFVGADENQAIFVRADGSNTVSINGSRLNTNGGILQDLLVLGQSNLRLGTNGTERMRIDTAGRVGIGTTSPNNPLQIVGADLNSGIVIGSRSPSLTGGNGISLQQRGQLSINYTATTTGPEVLVITRQNSTTGTTKPVEFRRDDGSAVGSITITNAGTSYNTTSDYRLKENVVALSGAIERIARLPVHRFNFIADPERTIDGFLAHEVQEVVPEAVTGEKDEIGEDGAPVYQHVDHSKLIPILTAALQTALERVDDLENELAFALERISRLEEVRN